MNGRRLKLSAILATAVLALAILGSWTQAWFTVTLTTGQAIEVTGDVAAPALTALALCVLVLLGALAIAGPFFRVVLSLLQAAIGATVVFSASLAIGSPVSASAAAITTASGVAGDKSTAALVDSFTTTAWPVISLVSGALLVVVAIGILVTSRTWPGSSRKYQPVGFDPAGTEAAPDSGQDSGAAVSVEPKPRSAIDDWDSLSNGADPTELVADDDAGDDNPETSTPPR